MVSRITMIMIVDRKSAHGNVSTTIEGDETISYAELIGALFQYIVKLANGEVFPEFRTGKQLGKKG